MSDLMVLAFKHDWVADAVVRQLEAMQREGLIDITDWARVIRHERGRLDVREGASTPGVGADGSAMIGLFVGLLFLLQASGGAAPGTPAAAIVGTLREYGVDRAFIDGVRRQLRPGTSALILHAAQPPNHDVVPRLREFDPRILRTSLAPAAQEPAPAAAPATES